MEMLGIYFGIVNLIVFLGLLARFSIEDDVLNGGMKEYCWVLCLFVFIMMCL